MNVELCKDLDAGLLSIASAALLRLLVGPDFLLILERHGFQFQFQRGRFLLHFHDALAQTLVLRHIRHLLMLNFFFFKYLRRTLFDFLS